MTMSRSFERLYPWIFGFAAGLSTHLMGITLPNDDSRLTALLSASISTSAILVGFLATIKAILMALPDSSIKTQLRDSGEMITLSSYLSSSMTANLIFCILNIGCFFRQHKLYQIWYQLFGSHLEHSLLVHFGG